MEYQFRIDDAFTPATIPMERLGEYVKALAKIMGEAANVHFEKMSEGSVVLHAIVDRPAQNKVLERLRELNENQSASDAGKAFGELDEMLRLDGATGRLFDESGAIILPFPGRNKEQPVVYGPFQQEGTLVGQVIRVGGRDDTIPVHLRDGTEVLTGLNATKDVARRIAQHLLGPAIQVHGIGTWYREGDGNWLLKYFKITDFTLLDEAPIGDVVARLRSVRGSDWNDVRDPVNELLVERHGGRVPH